MRDLIKLRHLGIHVCLIMILLTFNNCSKFESVGVESGLTNLSSHTPPPLGGYLKVGSYDSFIGPVFDYNSLIQAIPQNTTVYGPFEGKFRMSCWASHESKDDPVSYPGMPGASFLRTYFGNREVNAFSTYESLRNSGDTSCGSVLNRSSYSMPALLNGDETVVIRPETYILYYTRNSEGSEACTKYAKDCKQIPRGFRFVYGYDFKTGDPGVARWLCVKSDGNHTGPKSNIVDAAKDCAVGDTLLATLDASPNCWDGENLDTPDHRSHITTGGYGSIGKYHCPSTHPYLIPAFTIKAFYKIDETLDRTGTYVPGVTKTWHLASDKLVPNALPGQTLHADWFGAWDDKTQDRWLWGCIDRALGGNNGDLCDGGRIQDSTSLPRPPTRVPVPK